MVLFIRKDHDLRQFGEILGRVIHPRKGRPGEKCGLTSPTAAAEVLGGQVAGERILMEPVRPPPIQPTGVFHGLRPGAILLGVLVDTLATFVTSALLIALFAAGLAGAYDGELPEGALEPLLTSPEFLLASLVAGLLCTAFAGYVGAKRAACFCVRHGAWIAVGSAVAGQEGPHPPLWFDLVGFTLMIPAGALGGLLADYHLRILSSREEQ
jgi:hypothetical protein